MKARLLLPTIAALFAVAGPTYAVPITLTFEGLGNGDPVGNFYGGVQFPGDALAVTDDDVGGSGNFDNAPSGVTALIFLGSSGIVNIGGGFDTAFSFFYATPNSGQTVNVYDGLNGTGNLLGSATLTSNLGGCGSVLCVWTQSVINFAGVGLSIDFGGVVGNALLDDLTYNPAGGGNGGGGGNNNVPEPATLALLGLGLLGVAAGRRRKV